MGGLIRRLPDGARRQIRLLAAGILPASSGFHTWGRCEGGIHQGRLFHALADPDGGSGVPLGEVPTSMSSVTLLVLADQGDDVRWSLRDFPRCGMAGKPSLWRVHHPVTGIQLIFGFGHCRPW